MAKIDLKDATIKLWDGTLPTLTNTNSNGDDGKILLTAISKHIGSNAIYLTLTDAGSGAGSVVVTGRSIVVVLASDGSITETATTLKTAIDGNSDAAALVTVAQVGAGSALIEAQVKTALSGQQSITIKIGEGTLTYSEKKPREFVKDRGNLDTVRDADQEPMDVAFDFIWDFIIAESGGSAPTVEEVLKLTGIASTNSWLTTATDVCQPYCVDIEIANTPTACTSVQNEFSVIEEFYYENLDHDAKEGSVSCSGRSNRTVAVHTRAAA